MVRLDSNVAITWLWVETQPLCQCKAFLAGNGMDIPSVGFVILAVQLACFPPSFQFEPIVASHTQPGVDLCGADEGLLQLGCF